MEIVKEYIHSHGLNLEDKFYCIRISVQNDGEKLNIFNFSDINDRTNTINPNKVLIEKEKVTERIDFENGKEDKVMVACVIHGNESSYKHKILKNLESAVQFIEDVIIDKYADYKELLKVQNNFVLNETIKRIIRLDVEE